MAVLWDPQPRVPSPRLPILLPGPTPARLQFCFPEDVPPASLSPRSGFTPPAWGWLRWGLGERQPFWPGLFFFCFLLPGWERRQMLSFKAAFDEREAEM